MTPLSHTPPEQALDAFAQAIGARSVLTLPADLSSYLADWSGDFQGSALAVLLPSSTEEVSACLRIAGAYGLAVIPQGGNTGLVGGTYADDPKRHILLNLRRMNRIRRVDGLNFSVEVEAGAILEELKMAADAAGLFFPLAFGSQGSCQIGGNISTNAGGLNVLRYGMTRSLVLGLETVLPDGRIFNGLGKLWKDNRGIDLKQLFIGAEGTLGVVTAAVLKLFAKPENIETSLLGLAEIADAAQIFLEARHHFGDLLSAFELIDGPCLRLVRTMFPQQQIPMASEHLAYVLLEFSSGKAVPLRGITESFLQDLFEKGMLQDAVLATSQEQAHRIWCLREAIVEAQTLKGRHFRSDVSLPLSAISDFIQEAREAVLHAVPECLPIIYGHMGDGNIHFNVLAPEAGPPDSIESGFGRIEEALYGVVDRFEGSISAEHGIGRAKRERFLRKLPSVQENLLKTIATGFDPDGRMNPGCFLP